MLPFLAERPCRFYQSALLGIPAPGPTCLHQTKGWTRSPKKFSFIQDAAPVNKLEMESTERKMECESNPSTPANTHHVGKQRMQFQDVRFPAESAHHTVRESHRYIPTSTHSRQKHKVILPSQTSIAGFPRNSKSILHHPRKIGSAWGM